MYVALIKQRAATGPPDVASAAPLEIGQLVSSHRSPGYPYVPVVQSESTLHWVPMFPWVKVPGAQISPQDV